MIGSLSEFLELLWKHQRAILSCLPSELVTECAAILAHIVIDCAIISKLNAISQDSLH